MWPRALSLCRGRDARHLARRAGRSDAGGESKIFLDLQLSDADLGRHRRDRLAGRWRGDHEPDSAVTLLKGSQDQKAMAQSALDRWWWPVLMMFGPPDKASQHSDTSTKWKIKRFSNDELRQKFVDATVPQAEFLGLTIPDPGMKQNASGNWEYSAIDWEEFNQVLAGNGPCNRDRLAARRKAHDEGAWVREAATAYADKRKARQLAQAAE